LLAKARPKQTDLAKIRKVESDDDMLDAERLIDMSLNTGVVFLLN
jgi:hypothetical protein